MNEIPAVAAPRRRFTPWREPRRWPMPPPTCDRCGHSSLDPDELPTDPGTGAAIRSNQFVGWSDAVLCQRCWWQLNKESKAR